MNNDEAPLLKYTKIYAKSFICAILPLAMITHYNRELRMYHKLPVYKGLFSNASSTVNPANPFNELMRFLSLGKYQSIVLAISFTSFSIVRDFIKGFFNYSERQAQLRAIFIVMPAYLFLYYDRPKRYFWWQVLFLSCFICNIIY
jgi:hypothetical protein